MKLAVIPARGGSKRIPRKNIRPFCGKPIIAYSIEAALESELFDEVIVSTDDEEIAKVAEQYGADIPFLRSAKLSDDFAGTMPVVQDAIQRAEKFYGADVQYVCCIYATAPLIQLQSLQEGYAILKNNPTLDFALAATEFSYPIFRSFTLTAEGTCRMFWPEKFNARSQDLPKAYHDAGQFYWGSREAFLGNRFLFGEKSHPIILPNYLVQDIDTLDDWLRAESLFKLVEQSR